MLLRIFILAISLLWRVTVPKYFQYKICGYYLYFTSHCVIEAMHAHASDRALTPYGSAKFFIKKDGDTVVTDKGDLSDRDINNIQAFIKNNYLSMALLWSKYSEQGFYGGE